MPFLTAKQQRQSTEGKVIDVKNEKADNVNCFSVLKCDSVSVK